MHPLFLVFFLFYTSYAHKHQLNTTSWHALGKLVNAERGANVTGVSDLKRYLNRFGYLRKNANYTDVFDVSLETALSLYQSRLGLPITGRLDSRTLSQIMSPRCGVSDAAAPRRKAFAFFVGEPRWARAKPINLSYALSQFDTIDYIPRAEIRAILRRAFDRWSRVIPVNFIESEDYESADVKLAFFAGDHGDGEPFDGVLGVLAHAFSPMSGRLHFDAAERWAVDFGKEDSRVAVDLESVATHEIGHVLGLAHSTVHDAVMYPSLSPRKRKTELTADDVEGVQALYGSNPKFQFSSLMESVTSASQVTKETRTRWRSCIGILILLMVMIL
ncbi:metalloendoproteinase 1-MMP-like [Dioscorea cayenensis subsp. rotundata]|uniref:Metalloendoproteinase 1-MMP-like n=1 Tax=Dioscorea cayennensis subsp. rotundata TaxID=55577 RepID=A0AB40B7G9_DIOCR|nr:metalloendoproteinase 1-MMP-like [Dioscorea cayenensis subsp. rotundata]